MEALWLWNVAGLSSNSKSLCTGSCTVMSLQNIKDKAHRVCVFWLRPAWTPASNRWCCHGTNNRSRAWREFSMFKATLSYTILHYTAPSLKRPVEQCQHLYMSWFTCELGIKYLYFMVCTHRGNKEKSYTYSCLNIMTDIVHKLSLKAIAPYSTVTACSCVLHKVHNWGTYLEAIMSINITYAASKLKITWITCHSDHSNLTSLNWL